MQRLKLKQVNPRRFIASPQKHVLSTPKLSLQKKTAQQEQRVRNYIYKRSNFLGKGFSSKVYKAYKADNLLKPYAIKIINLAQLNYDQRRSLQHQLKVHRSLTHSNIVKCFQTFKTTSNLYLILEYCQHGTLSDYLKTHKRLDQSSTINIFSQIYQGYLYLANLKILHRDLKPQNILRKDNSWKITDLGFSCYLQGQTYEDDMNVGTPLYMPLESLTKDVYSFKSDIFALGIIVYKMLTGVTPWKCETQKQLIRLMSSKKIQFPEVRNKFLLEFLNKSLLNLNQLKQLIPKLKQQQITLQKLEQTNKIKDLHRFQSNKSTTTANSLSSSKNNKKLSSQNSSLLSSNYEIQIISQKQFADNQKIILQELQNYRIIHHMILNIDSLIVDQTSNPQTCQNGLQYHTNVKQILIVFFYKYVLKNMRNLNSFFLKQSNEIIFNYVKSLGIKNIEQFIVSKSFISLGKLIKQRSEFYQAQFLQSYIKKSILTIRFINKKFPQLGQNNLLLQKNFYINSLNFLKISINQLQQFIIQSLENVNKMSIKQMKKDRILSYVFWVRLYVSFIKKLKLLQMLEFQGNSNSFDQQLGQFNKEIKEQALNKQIQKLAYEYQPDILNQNQSNQANDHKVSQNQHKKQTIKNEIQKLNQIKNNIKIQYLYNFQQTTLQFKYFLEIKKYLNQLQSLAKTL